MHGSRITVFLLPMLLLLAGCASAAPEQSFTLLDTKSSAQLLRNDAVGRLDPALLDRVRKSNDSSVECPGDSDSPAGFIRQWKSSADLSLVAGADGPAAAQALVQTFVDQGWKATASDEGSKYAITVLSKQGSAATVEIAGADESASALVRVAAFGPCVMTEGPDSDEVTSLG